MRSACCAFDPLSDVNANNYLGTRSLEENLRFVGELVETPCQCRLSARGAYGP